MPPVLARWLLALALTGAGSLLGWLIGALVRHPAEGAGLGARLLAKACADLKAAGFDEAHLFTDPDSKAARL